MYRARQQRDSIQNQGHDAPRGRLSSRLGGQLRQRVLGRSLSTATLLGGGLSLVRWTSRVLLRGGRFTSQ